MELKLFDMKRFFLLLFICFMMSDFIISQNVLHEILKKNKTVLSPVIENPDEYEVQIVYTQINRDKNNIPHFDTHTFHLNDQYFYPASTIKMPVAFLALEKLNQLQIRGLHKNAVMKHGVGSAPQTAAEVDSSAQNKLPSLAHYIKKIFLVSDNDANNRLYEFLGQAYLNQKLYDKGFQHSFIIHRLGGEAAPFSIADNTRTNPVSFYEGEELLYFQGEVSSKAPRSFEVQNTSKGKAYMSNGKLINKPFDFSQKNYLSLLDLHHILRAVMLPEGIPEYQRFDLTEEDYQFLYKWMSAKPRAAKYPYYDEPDGYVKFFLYEGKAEKIPDHIKIFNKVGYAYGYLTDVAYIIDTEAKLEFMLSATIHVNANQVFNDNVYEYDSIGLPFLKNLGTVIYDYEKNRTRKYSPDLSKFIE